MAVSQYLRPESLLEAVRSRITPDVVHNASSMVGESESSTSQALNHAVPSVLGGLGRMASSSEGAAGLAGMFGESGYDFAVTNTNAIFSGGTSTSKMMDLGHQLTNRIFGSKSAGVSDVIAKTSGVSGNSATKLLGLVAPLTMGVLGRHVTSQGLNASGLSNLFTEQKDEIAAALPTGMSRVFEPSGPVPVPLRNEAAERPGFVENRRAFPADVKRTSSGSRWLIWLLAAMAAIGLFMLFRGRGRQAANIATEQAHNATTAVGNAAQQAAGALTSLSLPGGVHLNVPQGSINYNLATFLGSNDAAPRTFIFDHLNFETGSTSLTPESVATVDNLASVLKAYPNARIQLAGYTDNVGDPQANQQLSLSRADSVKAILANQGINPNRIMTIGMGQDHPVASNDTEPGRASNRRLELTVISK